MHDKYKNVRITNVSTKTQNTDTNVTGLFIISLTAGSYIMKCGAKKSGHCKND